MARRSKKSSSVKVDFTGVESRVTVPEGDYLVKVAGVKQEEGDKADYFAWDFEIVDGKHEGSNLYLNTSLSPKALWNLRNLLMSLGVEVPNGELDIELEELTDLELMVVVAHETYEGKKQSRIVDFYPSEEDGEDKKKDKDEDEKGSRRRGRDKEEENSGNRGSRRSRRGDDDEKEEKSSNRGRRGKGDDEEEDKGSRRSRRGKDKDLEKLTEAEVEDMDDDALEDTNEKYDLGLDLEDYKSRRKKIGAVIDALEEKDMIEEEKRSRR